MTDRTMTRFEAAGQYWKAAIEQDYGRKRFGVDHLGGEFRLFAEYYPDMAGWKVSEADRPALEEFAVTLCKQLDKWEGWRPWSEVGEAKESGRVVIFDWPGGSVSHKVRWIANRERWRNLAGRYREYEDRSFDKALWTYAPGEKA